MARKDDGESPRVAGTTIVGTTAEVSEMIHVGEDEVRRLAREGRLRHFRTAGGHLRFPLADVMTFIDRACEVASERQRT